MAEMSFLKVCEEQTATDIASFYIRALEIALYYFHALLKTFFSCLTIKKFGFE